MATLVPAGRVVGTARQQDSADGGRHTPRTQTALLESALESRTHTHTDVVELRLSLAQQTLECKQDLSGVITALEATDFRSDSLRSDR